MPAGTELESGNIADQKVNDTVDEKCEAEADGKIEAASDEKFDAAADEKGDVAVDGGVFTPAPVGKLLIVCGHDQHQGKWVALLDRKGSGHVQVNGKTITKYSFGFLNSGDELVLSQAENNAYSPLDVWTSAGKGKLLNIENQVEDALAFAHAFDLSLDSLELDSAANIGSNNAADFELSIGTGNAKSFAEPFFLAFLL
ncbi:hypothetical protein CQW23_31026 [Capsicum baccatum]|uniref:Uncharacterized protein n=1 Tax=Capsicum baccatum TaxID=33114 RepID=A0A2G2V8Q3_CAPBA|nr:hypothetical protein CQW23_31026 [Capsicum baccatum]